MTSDNFHTTVSYPSDLSDEEWAIIEQVLNELDPYKTGRRRDSNLSGKRERKKGTDHVFYMHWVAGGDDKCASRHG
jgi:hypothetical protein